MPLVQARSCNDWLLSTNDEVTQKVLYARNCVLIYLTFQQRQLFTPEVRWNFPPSFRIPLQHQITILINFEPAQRPFK